MKYILSFVWWGILGASISTNCMGPNEMSLVSLIKRSMVASTAIKTEALKPDDMDPALSQKSSISLNDAMDIDPLKVTIDTKSKGEAARELSFAQSLAVGSATGATEVLAAGQVLTYMMNQVVQGRPIFAQEKTVLSNLLHCYRGGLTNVAGMAPITAIQMTANSEGQRMLQAWQGAPLSNAQKIGTAFAAGFLSALAATPSESVPLYMQKHRGISTRQAFKDLKLKVWRGFLPTGCRDGGFTVGYIELNNIMQEQLQSVMGDSVGVKLLASTLSGCATAVTTHPYAVIKTKLQADMSKEIYANSLDVIKDIRVCEGLPGFFKAIQYRGVRILVAVPLMSVAGDVYKKLLLDLQKAQKSTN